MGKPKTEERAVLVLNGEYYLATKDERQMLREIMRAPVQSDRPPDRRHWSEDEDGRTD